jgi:hypothetical protein
MHVPVPPRGFAFYPTPWDGFLADLRASTGTTIREVDVRAVHDKMALLAAMAEALAFPPLYRGHLNYDSFEEAVRDLSWLPFDTIVIVLIGCAHLWAENYPVMAEMLEILTDAHGFWHQNGKTFFVAFVA